MPTFDLLNRLRAAPYPEAIVLLGKYEAEFRASERAAMAETFAGIMEKIGAQVLAIETDDEAARPVLRGVASALAEGAAAIRFAGKLGQGAETSKATRER